MQYYLSKHSSLLLSFKAILIIFPLFRTKVFISVEKAGSDEMRHSEKKFSSNTQKPTIISCEEGTFAINNEKL